ncbi:MAG: hypothetical protein EU539_00875 [Promethearchaeota archaeon]|nr:MAG: hypothetical protein EU539_00875 [Candidatus Lokiarchaeota archaeon]
MQMKFIVMNSEDNCATSLTEIAEHEEIEINGGKMIKINQKIPLGHKFALEDIKTGDLIKKYGQIIGIATEDIQLGDWIHVHNMKSHYLEEVVK